MVFTMSDSILRHHVLPKNGGVVAAAASLAMEEAGRQLGYSVSSNTRTNDLPLYDASDIPDRLKGNPFIRSYYRCGYTTKQCLRSVLALHNETANIWTHLLGFIVALSLSIHALMHLGLARAQDYCVFVIFEIASLVMLGGSSAYHTLAAHHSEHVHNCALALDYFGITFMIVGSFYPPVFYLFACMPVVRLAYLTAVTLLGVLGLAGPFFSFFNTSSFYWPRLILYASLTSLGFLPTVHMYYGLPTNELTLPVYKGMFLMLLIYFVGMVIYIFKAPERWFPGQFDLWLHSHQLWHFFVLAAAVVHFFTCMAAFQLWRVTGTAGGECV